ncbi:MAG: hypothetical protein N2043_01835 [Ignavibacterium sp.]|nr:hypothetical protein [Ignavibacterium sp.]
MHIPKNSEERKEKSYNESSYYHLHDKEKTLQEKQKSSYLDFGNDSVYNIKTNHTNFQYAMTPTPCGVECPYLNKQTLAYVYASPRTLEKELLFRPINEEDWFIQRIRYLSTEFKKKIDSYTITFCESYPTSSIVVSNEIYYLYHKDFYYQPFEIYSLCEAPNDVICNYKEQIQDVLISSVHSYENWDYDYYYNSTYWYLEYASFWIQNTLSSYTRCNRYVYFRKKEGDFDLTPYDLHQKSLSPKTLKLESKER